MSRKEFLRWEKLRLKGKNYVVLRTAVIYGTFFLIALNLASWAWSGLSLPIAFLIVYPALGLITGSFIWWMNEGRFAEFMSDKKSASRR